MEQKNKPLKDRILGDGDLLSLGSGLYLPVLTMKEIEKLWELLK